MPQTDHTNDWDAAREKRYRDAWLEVPPKINGQVALAEYNPEWPRLYEREAETIRSVLGDQALQLEHTGSTSVPGLAAKPIIDIILVVADPTEEQAYVPYLEGAGYRLVLRQHEWYEHRLLRKGPVPDINLHVHMPANPEIEQALRFRNHLRDNEADRQLYEDTKRRLAAEQWAYTQQYTNAKTEVIEEILQRTKTTHAS
jgi:GrpB-like predicted nucleotidyltransferase (UPF0157 family)